MTNQKLPDGMVDLSKSEVYELEAVYAVPVS